MTEYCKGRVWASGDTEDCGKPAVVKSEYRDYTGKMISVPLCTDCARCHFDSLKTEITKGLDTLSNKVREICGLSTTKVYERMPYPPSLTPYALVDNLLFISRQIKDLALHEKVEPSAEDKDYWMKRAKEAEKQLKDLRSYGTVFNENKSKEIRRDFRKLPEFNMNSITKVGQKVKIPCWEYQGFTPYRIPDLIGIITHIEGTYHIVKVENDSRYNKIGLYSGEFSLIDA